MYLTKTERTMPRRMQTADEIRESIHQRLYVDSALDGMLADIPYISVQPLPSGQNVADTNWTISCAGASPEMTAAVYRAMAAVQAEVDLAVPPLGSSAF